MNKWCCIFLMLFVFSCQKEEETAPLHFLELAEVPAGFPAIDYPEDNSFTKERWQLGKRLFFDPIMSVDSSISCGTCHKPELAFSDDIAFSPGVADRPGVRNTPTLANIAYHPYFTREGGVPTLEMQVLVPIQEHNEFDFNIVLIAERLAADSLYTAMAEKAYDRAPDAFVITRALACFERTLLSGQSRYDHHINGSGIAELSESERNGMDLFFSAKTNCSKCHNGFDFTNYAFENNGLYQSYEDPGRFRLTGIASDSARFKVPSLRNIALTAPYMHDGSMNSLSEVIDHYQNSGANHPQKSEFIRPFTLTTSEKEDLIAFLKSLTDEAFINHPFFKQ